MPGTVSGRPAESTVVAGDVRGLGADLADAAQDHVVDVAGVHAGPVEDGAQRVRGEVGRVDAGSPPLRRPTGVRTAATM